MGLSIKPKELENVLIKLGYKCIRQKGSHKVYVNADKTIIVIPMHNKDMKEGLLRRIMKDLNISETELRKLL